ncbi:sugar transferase [Pseudomonas sp. GX19020]|uniref:sugar transferase n=1 Tax=Pseudomonas sp. GX19020 TaxID=2942277 RepID=UPI002019351A|nr:sugar transferase [Pseudomonas sp. GX19020]MCL4068456.1 sugar transferase [Pseudomonas sp. GX19020]
MSLSETPFGVAKIQHRKGLKRLCDFALALITLPITLPMMLMIAVAIRVGSGGPALMRLSCLGMNGRVFRQYRFRVIRGDLSAADLLHANAADAGHLTPLGAVLLSTGLNLLPQVLNVLWGDMSFIGPRAVAVAATDRREKPDNRLLAVRPGIVTPDAFHPAGQSLSESERMALSLAYVRCAGACTDGRLVLQSAARIFRRRG